MNKKDFFVQHNININDELVELPRYRDASIHYYHVLSGNVYSQYISKHNYDTWYIAPNSFRRDLIFQHLYPEEHKKNIERKNKETKEYFRKLNEIEMAYKSRFLSPEQILNKYKLHNDEYPNLDIISISKEFIKDVIDNKHSWIGLTKTNKYNPYNDINQRAEIMCPNIMVELDHEKYYDYTIILPSSLIWIYNESSPIRRYDSFIYDFEFKTQLYIRFLHSTIDMIDNNTVIPLITAHCTDIEFLYKVIDENGDEQYVEAYGMTYKSIIISRELENILRYNLYIVCQQFHSESVTKNYTLGWSGLLLTINTDDILKYVNDNIIKLGHGFNNKTYNEK